MKKSVLTIDSRKTTELVLQNNELRVNWLVRRSLFDFDEILLLNASDEDVERFAVQVGNDTDATRKQYYKQIQCEISPGCRLSENTLRILRRMFGDVRIANT